MKKNFVLITLLLSLALHLAARPATRQKIDFNFDWNFSLTDSQKYILTPFDKSHSESVQLPHDWNVKQDFDSKWGGATAYLPEGIGWYQKEFILPASTSGRQVSIVFDWYLHAERCLYQWSSFRSSPIWFL